MRAVLLRGVVGSALITVGGSLYERVAHQTWADHLPLLWSARTSAHHLGWGLALSVAGLLLLSWAWWDLRRDALGRVDGLDRVRLAACAWAAPMLVAPPLFSGDGWSYVATGALTGRGLSPYLWTPAALPGPLQSGVSPRWLTTPSPYGPLPLAWGGALSHLTQDPWALLAGYRVLSVLSLVLLAWAVPVIARRTGVNPVDASVLVVASPFVLAHGIGGLHNDLTMVALMLAALAVTRKDSWWPGAVLVGAAAAVKAPGLLAAVGVVLLSLASDARWYERLRRAAAVGAVAGLVLLAAGWVTGLGTGWFGALLVPESEHTRLAITWVLGRWIRTLLIHAGPSGIGAAHALHVPALAKKVGLVLLGLTAVWVLLLRRAGTTARAFSGMGIVLLAAVLLSPATHFWYFLWCVPLLACLPLARPLYVALVAGIVALGLTAPADPMLHSARLIEWADVAVLLVPVVAGVLAAVVLRRRTPMPSEPVP